MPVKYYKPTTPGRRKHSVNTFEQLTVSKPEKSLLAPIRKSSGRNNLGRVTVRHRGGGHKRMYRKIDFARRDKLGIEAVVQSIEYDPNRSAFIALVFYKDGEKRYVLAHRNMQVGDVIVTSEKAAPKEGNRMQLENIPVTYKIYNVQIAPDRNGQLVRSAGSAATLVSLDGEKAQVQMPSGEIRLFEKNCFATIGQVSNIDHNQIRWGKAGRMRWKGRKPQVLGKSMNPVDHPHGGGEQHNSIGMKYPKTPWGAHALGVRTRKKKKWSNRVIAKSRHSSISL